RRRARPGEGVRTVIIGTALPREATTRPVDAVGAGTRRPARRRLRVKRPARLTTLGTPPRRVPCAEFLFEPMAETRPEVKVRSRRFRTLLADPHRSSRPFLAPGVRLRRGALP